MKTRAVLRCVAMAGLLGAMACDDRSRCVEHYKPLEAFEKAISLDGSFENEVVSISVDGDLFHRIAVNNDGIIAHTGYELAISKERCEIELVNWLDSCKLSSLHSCHPKVIGLAVRGKVHELVLDSLKKYSYVVIVDDSLHIQMSDTVRVRDYR